MNGATRYCLCGGSLQARSTPQQLADLLVAEFDRLHADDGHGPATPRQASQARRREDLAALQEDE